MAKKNSKRRRSNGIQVPIAIVAGMAPGLVKTWEHSKQGLSAASREAGRIYLGFDWWDGKFNWQWLTYGTLPIIAGALVHKFVGGKLGVNRMIANAGIPFIRL